MPGQERDIVLAPKRGEGEFIKGLKRSRKDQAKAEGQQNKKAIRVADDLKGKVRGRDVRVVGEDRQGQISGANEEKGRPKYNGKPHRMV